MEKEKQQKYGFVYIWYDRYRKMYYIGSHWGTEDDGYICSSNWMRDAYRRRSQDFKRRILIRIYSSRENLLKEEQYWINMIKDEEISPQNTSSQKRKNVRYYNINKIINTKNWCYTEEQQSKIGEKISNSKKGKSSGPCSLERAEAISKAKKTKFAERGGMSEEHKAALTGIKKPSHTDEWKIENSKRTKVFWNSPEGLALKEKRRTEGNSEESKKKVSETLKAKGHKPSQETINASIKKCSKIYKVISPNGEEIIITNLKAFCREKGLTDINMVRKSGSKGWFAYLIQ